MTILILETPGSRLSVSYNVIEASVPKDPTNRNSRDYYRQKYGITEISGIIMGVGCSLTYKARKLLLQHGIPIVWKDNYKILGVTYTFHSHGTVIVRREQFQAIDDKRGTKIAKEFIIGGSKNKMKLLRYYARNRAKNDEELAKKMQNAADRIKEIIEEMEEYTERISEVRLQLMAIEGQITNIYYNSIREIIPEQYRFYNRNRRPPKDPINAALSYGYSALNGQSFLAITIAGLDPYAGFLHVDRSGRESLAIDLSEEFRQAVVDRAVIALATRKELDLAEDFEYPPDAVMLSKKGKLKVIGRMQQLLGQKMRINMEKRYAVEHHMLLQARKLAKYLVKPMIPYKAFVIDI